jgi:hypothetical protein
MKTYIDFRRYNARASYDSFLEIPLDDIRNSLNDLFEEHYEARGLYVETLEKYGWDEGDLRRLFLDARVLSNIKDDKHFIMFALTQLFTSEHPLWPHVIKVNEILLEQLEKAHSIFVVAGLVEVENDEPVG